MKYTLINCYSDNNKGDSGIILSTVELIREFDKNSDIVGVSTYNHSDPCFYSEHGFLKKYIDVLPSVFGELNIGKYKGVFAKNIRLLVDVIRMVIFLVIPQRSYFMQKFLFTKTELITIKRLRESDYVISKGGSFICNEDNIRDKIALFRFLFVFLVCFKMDKKLVILCQSLGPVYGKLSKKYVNTILKKCYWIVFRERICVKNYEYLDFDIAKSSFINDIAFHLTTNGQTPNIEVNKKNFNVGITIKEVNKKLESEYENMMVEGIKHCIDKFDAKIHIFPHVTIDNDVEVSFGIYKKMPDNYKQKISVYTQDYSAVELKSIYSNMNIFIGTRLHSTIFAIGEGVPSICISYHGTKSEGIFENYGLSKYAMNEYSDKLLINAIDSLVNDNLKVKKILDEKNNYYREELLTVFNKIFI